LYHFISGTGAVRVSEAKASASSAARKPERRTKCPMDNFIASTITRDGARNDYGKENSVGGNPRHLRENPIMMNLLKFA